MDLYDLCDFCDGEVVMAAHLPGGLDLATTTGERSGHCDGCGHVVTFAPDDVVGDQCLPLAS